MATATASTPTTDSPAQPRGGSARRGGDRGRGRGRGRGGQGGRGGGQGGRGDGRAGPRIGGQRKGPDGPQSTDGPVQAPEVNRQTTLQVGPAPPIVPVTPDADDAASNSSADICFICADPVQYSAIAPCNHVTCHICALRLRALYKSKSCAHCRTESDYVIFTKDADKRFEEFTDSDIVARNDALGIKYEDQAICDDTTLLLRYNCPDANCDRACRGWPDLHRHVRQDHGLVMCDLCTRHKKVFTHEHTLFTKAQLHKHERKGDDNPGSETQSGFKGHPECRFCTKRFYSNDELYEHCRHNHERCFICDRRNVGQQPSYYIDYPALERHFKNSHFMCQDRECLEKKFVVFEHEVDLKAHMLEAHPGGLSKSERRDARRVDMSTFQDARPAYQPRGGRGRGNQNYVYREGEQEQSRTVQSAQSLTSRTFGGQLTTEDFPLPGASASASASTPQAAQAPAIRPPAQPPAPVSRPPDAFPPLGGSAPRTAARIAAPAAPPRRQTAAEAFPPLGGSSRTITTPPNGRSSTQPSGSEPARPAARPTMTDEVRRLKHTAVIERASNLLRNDQQRIDTFRSYVSKFRTGTFSGEDLVEAFWALMDVSPADMGKLMNELIEIYEDERKQSELRRAWNNWKAINEDYPPIAGASSSSSTTLNPTTTASSNRVLRLKSSTQKSSRSSTARQTAWGTASHSYPLSDSTSRRSPPLPSSSSFSAPQQSTSTTSYARANGKQKAAAVVKRDEFPGLPQVNRKPANWTPVQAKKSSWEPKPPEVNPWAAGGSGEGQQQAEGHAEGEQTGGRKKKGKGKEVLFRVGL
ncbi:hypothetical protein EX30DRAFT_308693 [Ascodesmis nigricans]|uniref:RING-type E3 ubiquitin transferase n=1 Tax=Ascodesmis nigricans TaxID=341454 RepID=A0A4S2MQP7_9PEZI|nr:hypothetical protein EX30DRAFT_308693 [Ascodesmis nigricans]